MRNLRKEYVLLMMEAEKLNNRKDAIAAINKATAVRELIGAAYRYDLADYSGLR